MIVQKRMQTRIVESMQPAPLSLFFMHQHFYEKWRDTLSQLFFFVLPSLLISSILITFYTCLVSFLCGHFKQCHYTVTEGCDKRLIALTFKYTVATASIKAMVEGH